MPTRAPWTQCHAQKRPASPHRHSHKQDHALSLVLLVIASVRRLRGRPWSAQVGRRGRLRRPMRSPHGRRGRAMDRHGRAIDAQWIAMDATDTQTSMDAAGATDALHMPETPRTRHGRPTDAPPAPHRRPTTPHDAPAGATGRNDKRDHTNDACRVGPQWPLPCRAGHRRALPRRQSPSDVFD